jgi:hypothetical protein
MDVSVDITQELKDLTGQYKFPDDVAAGQGKISGKFSVGRINMAAFNQLMFAQTQTTGTKQIAADESHTFASSVAVTNLGTFSVDLGCRYAVNGLALLRLPSGVPAAGQYTVTAGTYTFSAADVSAGGSVLISYVWTTPSVGYTVPLNQTLQGYGPIFELWLSEPYQQTTVSSVVYGNGLHLWACRMSKLGQELKNSDYLKPAFEWQAFANSAGQVGEWFQAVA